MPADARIMGVQHLARRHIEQERRRGLRRCRLREWHNGGERKGNPPNRSESAPSFANAVDHTTAHDMPATAGAIASGAPPGKCVERRGRQAQS